MLSKCNRQGRREGWGRSPVRISQLFSQPTLLQDLEKSGSLTWGNHIHNFQKSSATPKLFCPQSQPPSTSLTKRNQKRKVLIVFCAKNENRKTNLGTWAWVLPTRSRQHLLNHFALEVQKLGDGGTPLKLVENLKSFCYQY